MTLLIVTSKWLVLSEEYLCKHEIVSGRANRELWDISREVSLPHAEATSG